MKKLVVMMLCCFMLLGCASNNTKPVENQDSKIKIQEGKGSVSNILLDDMIEKMDQKESFVIIVTQTYCNSCQSFFTETEEFLKESGVPLLELNLDHEKGAPDQVLDIVNEYLHEFVMTPSIYYIRDGEVIDQLLSSNERIQLANYKAFLLKNNIIKEEK